MKEVISVRFRSGCKNYYFSPGQLTVAPGQDVIVETDQGPEYVTCTQGNHTVEDHQVVEPLRRVLRPATENDRRSLQMARAREKEAFAVCQKKIAQRGLEMKLVRAESSFDGNKLLFFFTADGRVDFRELVKDLAAAFHARIELRQIGVRDEAKMLGGIGICGRPFCCSQFLDEFQPVSTKMAKIQSMSLNPSKISGTCGRLMCCLRYEEEAYENLVKTVPKNGAFVETPAGYGNVTQVNLLRRTVKVKLDGEGEDVFKTYSADDVAAIPGGRPKPGEPLPQLLKDRPAPEPAEQKQDDGETRPKFYPVEQAEPEQETKPRKSASEVPVRKRQGQSRGRGKRPEQPKSQTQEKETKPRKEPRQQKAAAAAKDQAKEPQQRRSGQNRRRRPGGRPKPPKSTEE